MSRISKSIKNSTVALGFYFVNLVLQFISRKVFLDHLGTEVLGLNTTAANLLQLLNLAELGIGSAIACTLYKPLFDNDTKTINEIVSLQGWFYRKVAWVIIGCSVVLTAFFPLIFSKMELPMWYAYASFGVLMASSLLSYFVNYKQIVLSADQQEYKITYSYKVSMLVKVLCQIVALSLFRNGYVWWLALELLFAVVASLALNVTINRTYPYLKTDVSAGGGYRKKYPGVITKIKQLFFHKIGGIALSQTSPIIIYAYASLSLVALYGNYMLIIVGVSQLMRAVFSSMDAGVGNLVAEGDKPRILRVFEELFSVRFWLGCTICFGVYLLTPGFITLWLGSEYVMDNIILVLMVATLYIALTRSVVDAYVNAYGLFADVWAPAIEASINIGLSVLFGYFWGLPGILAGVLVSLVLVICLWKPYYLFSRGLKESVFVYAGIYVKHIAILAASAVVVLSAIDRLSPDFAGSWPKLILNGGVSVLAFAALLFALLFAFTPGVRNFVKRFI